ncbi:unnamed protein product [Allacma fusca]|uniref:Uncharacterized protein n=1 Tax=Allacma fusca TaxID=39272 RepID=A0A8J2K2U1_9HEXA|nr:unnamed protein product [Allacma fusca]
MAKVMKLIDPALYTRLMELDRHLKQQQYNDETKETYTNTANVAEPLQSLQNPQLEDSSSQHEHTSEPIKYTQLKQLIVSCLGKHQQSKASKVLTFLMQSPDFQWLPTFEVKYKSQLIPKSNILDLISFITQSNPIIYTPAPTGIETFYDILQ